MLYQNTQELIEFLKQHQLWNKKSLGQNFLVNPMILEQIITAAEITKEDNIVEVGPGLGILTEKLLENAARVRAIEYDSALIPILQEHFGKNPHFELIEADALKTSLPTYNYKFVANIPYYITSPLLSHFLQPQNEKEKRPSLIVLLVQKEVAQKICARENDHSVLSLQVQIFGKPSIVATVSKHNFFPQPKVDSAILKIETYQKPLIEDTETFFRMIKAAFSQKRKKLSNSLQNLFQCSREEIIKILQKANIDENRRPQSLTMEEWRKLCLFLKKHE